MAGHRVAGLTLLAMLAFAGNSLLCRMALRQTSLDAATFTAIRLVSGALALWLLVRWRRSTGAMRGGSWPSAMALFVYAVAFSFAYVSLTAATGALLLFAAVQATMIGHGWRRGDRLRGRQNLGFALAAAGLVALLLPGLQAPPLVGSLLMVLAGVAWGVYSLRGRGGADPLCATAGNFVRAALPAAAFAAVLSPWATLDRAGVLYAMASGVIASGAGYAVWYAALRGLRTTSAAAVQLCVPVLAAVGGVVFLDERVTLRFVIASAAVLGGIALVVIDRRN